MSYWKKPNSNTEHNHHPNPPQNDCPREPGTLIRIYIPAGAEIDLGPIRISSPDGICLIVSIPFLGGLTGLNVNQIIDAIQNAGGSVQVENLKENK